MSTWQTDPFVTEEFPHWAKPATLDVDPGSGNVQLERRNAAGEWEGFETFDTAGVYKIEVVNCPEMRINPTVDASFRWTWAG
ncbi:hypothetical protein R3X27_15820 [Tropicimonas sp. TH_r6]|uniref:hypothetical protein n=1 Tax=Tropicimonas sp. TH_r6 TaxID=3082085 RepID=UPI002954C944|nr:hypothetical protein [Tropicimonas sp. TH_r6]MDV7144154.1 hypothetical protein [Tropicimonas sp. TH_r6]